MITTYSNITYISKNGVDFIKGFESFRPTPYKAVSTEKYLTIGYGHYGPDVTPDMVLTEQQASDLFAKDIGSYCRAVANAVTYDKCTQAMFDMMTSLCYNIGTGAFAKSSVASRLNAGDVKGSADAFMMWTKSGGVVLDGLVRRRTDERNIFLNGYTGEVTPIDPTTPDPTDPIDDGKGININDNDVLIMQMLLSGAMRW